MNYCKEESAERKRVKILKKEEIIGGVWVLSGMRGQNLEPEKRLVWGRREKVGDHVMFTDVDFVGASAGSWNSYFMASVFQGM